MTVAITPVSKIEQQLEVAGTPKESFQVEAQAKAGVAYHQEQRDFEQAFPYALVYIKAKCKTTELIAPDIRTQEMGRPNKYDSTVVLIDDFGLTNKQWERRKKLLAAIDNIDAYQDDCIQKWMIPTGHGLVGFGSKVHISDDSYEWYTPIRYIEAARKVLGNIDLDPASCGVANRVVKAVKYYTEEENGLTQAWQGNVFLNPPYNMPLVEQFTTKAIGEYEGGRVDAAIVLVNNATDTGWFHALLAYPMCFPRGRVSYWTEGGSNLGARQGQAFFYLGDDVNKFGQVFSNFGAVLKRYDD